MGVDQIVAVSLSVSTGISVWLCGDVYPCDRFHLVGVSLSECGLAELPADFIWNIQLVVRSRRLHLPDGDDGNGTVLRS
jgi:hypothetical protein